VVLPSVMSCDVMLLFVSVLGRVVKGENDMGEGGQGGLHCDRSCS
jgi:hypothetical protein